jgi:N-acetylglucosaminyldiphosphoundecaprenol N-acetyl-beta-D-mannosaminyltransferase
MITQLDIPTQTLFGVRVAALRMPEVLDRVHAAILGRVPLQIGVVNAAKLVKMRRNEQLTRDVLGCDLVLADGMGVVWASRILNRELPERVAGIDLMHGILLRGVRHGYRVYCLGATQEVLDRALAVLEDEYPGVRFVGSHHGYFSAQEEAVVAADIQRAQPDVLFVAMTSPRKEEFIARWMDHLGVTVCHGVGGSLDVVSGKVRRAPALWQRLGLEWLYRVKQEPGRLWRRYLVTNALFIALIIRELSRGARTGTTADDVERSQSLTEEK